MFIEPDWLSDREFFSLYRNSRNRNILFKEKELDNFLGGELLDKKIVYNYDIKLISSYIKNHITIAI